MTCGLSPTVSVTASFLAFVAVASSAPVPIDNYVFVSDVNRRVGVVRGEYLIIGKLDSAGNLNEIMRLEHGTPVTGLPPYVLLNQFGVDSTRVYEYRSGTLILGEIRRNGEFIPSVGSTITRFEDYKYHPNAIPIWNLPGYFKKVEKPKPGEVPKKDKP